jgi:hypothetical protein
MVDTGKFFTDKDQCQALEAALATELTRMQRGACRRLKLNKASPTMSSCPSSPDVNVSHDEKTRTGGSFLLKQSLDQGA